MAEDAGDQVAGDVCGAVKWVEPVTSWLREDSSLTSIGTVEMAEVVDFRTDITPFAIWGAHGAPGLPTVFPTRSVRRAVMNLAVEDGYLDGHRWIISRDGRFFTSDEAGRDGEPDLLTDLDTKIRSQEEEFELAPSHRIEDLNGTELAVSAEPSNWGSFLVRALPKIAAAASTQASVLAYAGHANQRAVIELLGVGKDRLVPHQPEVRYRLKDCLFRITGCAELWVSEELREAHRQAGDRAARLMGTRRWSPLIYLSRSGSIGRGTRRSLVNEDELMSALNARGFDILLPEDCAPVEVIAAVSQARILVTPGGAGMFNAVFAGPQTLVINLESEATWLYGHTNVLQSVLGTRWALFYGTPQDLLDPGAHRPWSVDVAALCAALDEVSL